MTDKHTPGSWTVGPSREGLKVSSGQLDVAYVLGQGAKAEANAYLIAGAPELLEALEACAEQLRKVQHRGYHDVVATDGPGIDQHGSVEGSDAAVEQQARDAIKAAKGDA